MDALDPTARLFVEGLARPSKDLFVAGADVNHPLPASVGHPEDLVDVFRQLSEAFLGLAQYLLGAPALIGDNAAPGSVQGFAQTADDRTDQQEEAQSGHVVYTRDMKESQ